MREIKFRGKEEYSGEWVYGYYCRGGWINPVNGIETPRHIIHAEYLFDVDPDTLGQYTGLKDKNGKEIYEGDVVVVTNLMVEGFGEQMLTSIVYDEELACFDFKASDRQRCICTSVLDAELEVIGNIFDNPELLEKE